jgi:hypothetical protein
MRSGKAFPPGFKLLKSDDICIIMRLLPQAPDKVSTGRNQ